MNASIQGEELQFVEIKLSTGANRRFFFRRSGTDLSVIRQIFEQQNYNLSGFALSDKLKSYANKVASAGSSLLAVDLGANIGASALYLLQLDPRIHVCAVEPEPGNFSVLETNCADLPITAIRAAIASEPGTMWISDPGIGEWGFRVGKSGQEQVEAITMTHILDRFGVSAGFEPLMCKIDIEGAETELFGANDAWVDEFPLIVIELHDWLLPGTSNSRNFLRAISKRNFDVVQRGENTFCFNNDLLAKVANP
jgi:FkbM family methyltransferase